MLSIEDSNERDVRVLYICTTRALSVLSRYIHLGWTFPKEGYGCGFIKQALAMQGTTATAAPNPLSNPALAVPTPVWQLGLYHSAHQVPKRDFKIVSPHA